MSDSTMNNRHPSHDGQDAKLSGKSAEASQESRAEARPAAVRREILCPRPNPANPYRCGLRESGSECFPGPTSNGVCCQQSRESESVKSSCSSCVLSNQCLVACRKDQSDHADDFTTCTPIKSHWYSRNLLALHLALLASGILLALMALPSRHRWFVPGGLSRSHTQILENTLVQDRCSLCHPDAQTASTNQGKVTQDQLCMNCHNSHMPDANLSSPHDLSHEQFVKLASLSESSRSWQHRQATELSQTRCAQCHVEHHGMADLKAMTDQRCQSCHAQQFNSFSHGHPEFSQFPRSQPRRIAFDHRSHLEKYYPQKQTQFDCKSCHELDPQNPDNILRTMGFDQACAQCHQEPIRASIIDGWTLIQLPSLNSSDLHVGSELLQRWPGGALYGYDGRLTLPLRFLLASDPAVEQAMKLFADGDLSQANPKQAEHVQAMQEIARAVRELIQETALEGQQAWKRRLSSVLQQALQRPANPAEQQLIAAMVSGVTPDLFQHMESSWFAEKSELATLPHRPMRVVSSQELLLDNSADTDLAEPSLAGSDDLLTSDESQDLLDSNDLELQDDASGKTPKAAKRFTAAAAIAEGGFYLDSKLYLLKYMPRGHADSVLAAWVQFAALVDSSASPNATRMASQEAAETGQTPQAWHQTNWKPGSEAVGDCTQCHLLPDYSSTTLELSDWRVKPASSAKSFTRFSHRPHMTLAATADCKHCHPLDSNPSTSYQQIHQSLSELDGGVVGRFVQLKAAGEHFCKEFKAIEKSQCNACHRPGGASQGCTQCHNYHVGSTGLEKYLQP